ncbi:PrsW family glutamic-type intramembrane protease [Chakrabartyella piscis]|uniref:PrsW family glutamic-type intramembrane protease n=1 Tax=Chakrabartyella piscis TaxID=2918914 RepID=UPI0029586BC3|nr:PrsW family glutamic-type intramembrane protease [Chakrabartyella piscis]
MIYLENIYFCLVAPFLVACVCAHKEQRLSLIFVVYGMTACLLSAYINLFFAQVYQTSILVATMEIAPLIEELMKLFPILYYLLVFEPKNKAVLSAMLMVAIGFATFENICYLVEHGTDNLQYLLMRGFGTGAMHIVCGTIMGYGLMFAWKYNWLKIMGTIGVLCIAVTYHAEYNLLMSVEGIWQVVGTMMPLLTIVIALILKKVKLK